MLLCPIVEKWHGEEADPGVLTATHHRLFRKEQQVSAEGERHLRWRRVVVSGVFQEFLPVGDPGLVITEFQVCGKGSDILHIRARRVDRYHVVMPHEIERKARWHAGREERRHVNDRCAAIAFANDIERSEDGWESGLEDPLLETRRVPGPGIEARDIRIDAVATP